MLYAFRSSSSTLKMAAYVDDSTQLISMFETEFWNLIFREAEVSCLCQGFVWVYTKVIKMSEMGGARRS